MTYELVLARRVQHEREKRRLTYEALAQRMTEAGCSMQPSAIFRIEKGEPQRRITVNELMAFADVFDVPVADLLLPAELVERAEVRELVDEYRTLVAESARLAEAHRRRKAEIRDRLHTLLETSDHAASALRAELNLWLGSDPPGWADEVFKKLKEGA